MRRRINPFFMNNTANYEPQTYPVTTNYYPDYTPTTYNVRPNRSLNYQPETYPVYYMNETDQPLPKYRPVTRRRQFFRPRLTRTNSNFPQQVTRYNQQESSLLQPPPPYNEYTMPIINNAINRPRPTRVIPQVNRTPHPLFVPNTQHRDPPREDFKDLYIDPHQSPVDNVVMYQTKMRVLNSINNYSPVNKKRRRVVISPYTELNFVG